MTIITLNYWRYYDLENRLPNILQAIQKFDPDILLFQEMQIDPRHSPFSQVETLKWSLKTHQYSIHSTIYPKTRQQGGELENPIQHGMAVLSKHPILNIFEYYPKTEGEPRSILCFDTLIDQKEYRLANIHLSNNEKSANKELNEFLNFLKKRGEKRIIAGDFNLYGLENNSKKYPDYRLSSDVQKYISYPKNDWCLDYVMIPKENNFKDFQVLDGYLSDHFGLFANIE